MKPIAEVRRSCCRCNATRCDFYALVVKRKITILFHDSPNGGDFMKKFLIAICSMVLALASPGAGVKAKHRLAKVRPRLFKREADLIRKNIRRTEP